MELREAEKKIDEIDDEIVDLYNRRMALTREIGINLREQGMPAAATRRERDILNRVGEKAGEENEPEVRALFSLILTQGQTRQMMDERGSGETTRIIRESIRNTAPLFPPKASVACQGAEGAYSQLACEKIFKAPSITYFKRFEDVFNAIDDGTCRYGVLPIENSLAGSVNSVYDLMTSRRFYIVRSTRIRIDHVLLVNPGTTQDDILEIYSHEQAIQQCSAFLAAHPQWTVNRYGNTAAAARMVAQSGRKDAAAISSAGCASLYGLECLKRDIQNNSNNHTRFICISREPEIYPGADHTTLMLVLPDRPGALYQMLGRFYARGINLTKLESRPMPGRDFEFMFCFDIDVSVYSSEFIRIMDELDLTPEPFVFLGSYSEVL